MTHSFWVESSSPPECEHCQVLLSVEHILVDCTAFHSERVLYHLNGKSIELILGEDCDVEDIMNFLKDIEFYYKI